MSNIVLVPGASAGAWQFGEVARLLRRAEHDVYPLTLTGLGDRSHLASPEVDLNTHITDVVNAILWEQLEDVVLLGTSYGGVVTTGVAERIPRRISKMIYLDAVLPQDGQSLLEAIAASGGQEIVQHFENLVENKGDGWRLPASGDPPRTTDQPFKTFTQPLTVGNPIAEGIPRVYIACTDTAGLGVGETLMASAAAHARAQHWEYYELHTGHTPQLSHPRSLAELLLVII